MVLENGNPIILMRKKGGALQPEQIEISSLDLRYEAYRLKAPGAEKILLASILENGIRDPLQGSTAREIGFCSMASSATDVPGSSTSPWCPTSVWGTMRLAGSLN